MSLPCRHDADPQLPGSIRAVIPHPLGGCISMAGFPGLETSVNGDAVFLPDDCRETLDGLRALGATSLTVLVEADELDQAFLSALHGIAEEVGLSIVHFPIVDYSIPTDAQTRDWVAGASARAKLLSSGGVLGFACQYGAGRSGMMAARCLIEGGMTPDKAISVVRSHFSEAIESDAQESWLLGSA